MCVALYVQHLTDTLLKGQKSLIKDWKRMRAGRFPQWILLLGCDRHPIRRSDRERDIRKKSKKLVTKKERERDDLPRRVSANLVGRSCSDRVRSAAAAVWLGGKADEAFTSDFSPLRCVAWHERGECIFLQREIRVCCGVAAVWREYTYRRRYTRKRDFTLYTQSRETTLTSPEHTRIWTCGRQSRAIVHVVWHTGQRPAAVTPRSRTERASVPRIRLEPICWSRREESEQEAARLDESEIFLWWVFIMFVGWWFIFSPLHSDEITRRFFQVEM